MTTAKIWPVYRPCREDMKGLRWTHRTHKTLIILSSFDSSSLSQSQRALCTHQNSCVILHDYAGVLRGIPAHNRSPYIPHFPLLTLYPFLGLLQHIHIKFTSKVYSTSLAYTLHSYHTDSASLVHVLCIPSTLTLHSKPTPSV